MKSPFKFLDSYKLADKDIFFGREQETQTLYQYVHATSLVLLYGLSGTGKSSLVECGLANRFDGPDWHPFNIRRGHNLNDSLKSELTKIIPRPPATDDLPTLVNAVFRYYLRPVYLIFDQFEELFTIRKTAGEEDKHEQVTFFNSLRDLIAQPEIPCKVILIMREEFIGQLYEYEAIIPSIFDYRLRVEPMNARMIGEVVTRSFEAFNIDCNPPTLTAQIRSNLLSGETTSQLTYLQVYLDQLWQQGEHLPRVASEKYTPVRITDKTLVDTGSVDNVLQGYLDQQDTDIELRLGLPVGTVLGVLDYFVTNEGTKLPLPYRQEQGLLIVDQVKVPDCSPNKVSDCLRELEAARLTRKDGRFMEIAHDTLAKIINQKRTGEQRLLANLRQSFKTSYELWQTNRGGLLNEQNVALYDQFQEKLSLPDEYLEFIGKSREANKKAAAKEASAKWAKWLNIILGVGVVGAALVVFYIILLLEAAKASERQAIESGFEAQRNLVAYQKARAQLLLIDAKTYINSGDYCEAVKKLEEAHTLDRKDKEVNDNLLKYKSLCIR